MMQDAMIAAALAPGCPSAWQRGIFALVGAGVLGDVPLADRWPSPMWFGLPAILFAAAALAAARLNRPRLLIVLLGLSGSVSLWLPLILSPLLLAIRRWPSTGTWRASVGLGALLYAAAYAATPACPAMPAAVDGGVTLLTAARGALVPLGAAGMVLVLLRIAFGARGRVEASMILAITFSVLMTWLVPAAGLAILLAPAVAALWWLALAGGGMVVRWQASPLARAGAAALVLVAPVVIAPSLYRARAAQDADAPVRADAAEVWASLARTTAAGVVSDGDRLTVLTSVWRGSPADHGPLLMLPESDRAILGTMPGRAVYAWPGSASRLADRGFLLGVAAAEDGSVGDRPLSRVLGHEPCADLTAEWTEVTAISRHAQVSAVTPVMAPLRGALVYAGSATRVEARPLDWPPDGIPGFEVQVFDGADEGDRRRLAEAAVRDGFELGRLGGARFVSRVRMDRRGSSPEVLPIWLGGGVTAAWARLYSPGEGGTDRVALCRRSTGQVVAGYDEAPAVMPVDLLALHLFGAGWHGPERSGDGDHRWTSGPDAEVFLVLQGPEPLELRIDAESAGPLRVTLNGEEAVCAGPQPPCNWVLPIHAMTAGVNIVEIHTTPVPAPPPDPRILGAMVRSLAFARM